MTGCSCYPANESCPTEAACPAPHVVRCVVCDDRGCEYCPKVTGYPYRDSVEDVSRPYCDGPADAAWFAKQKEATVGTDHSKDITALRDRARQLKTLTPNAIGVNVAANGLLCAAALLEVHDMTGISLDDWRGPREFVEDLIGHPITENEV